MLTIYFEHIKQIVMRNFFVKMLTFLLLQRSHRYFRTNNLKKFIYRWRNRSERVGISKSYHDLATKHYKLYNLNSAISRWSYFAHQRTRSIKCIHYCILL